ncbi:uncharacterized protein BKA55DRAFT_548954 [Fusarium redolens]|uniref:Uncharacterized protein n=1 Tax=Fusarium redolens TaxID=48865 RepID=A0A9P9R933_FUSRE|nr:uncharacterized protein BKA55DRAFT_548954 [Fusarium redolens]KAH7269560.1 hypothetical protein BKA55DRAFT_548954 [Fusarium redolens]
MVCLQYFVFNLRLEARQMSPRQQNFELCSLSSYFLIISLPLICRFQFSLTFDLENAKM